MPYPETETPRWRGASPGLMLVEALLRVGRRGPSHGSVGASDAERPDLGERPTGDDANPVFHDLLAALEAAGIARVEGVQARRLLSHLARSDFLDYLLACAHRREDPLEARYFFRLLHGSFSVREAGHRGLADPDEFRARLDRGLRSLLGRTRTYLPSSRPEAAQFEGAVADFLKQRTRRLRGAIAQEHVQDGTQARRVLVPVPDDVKPWLYADGLAVDAFEGRYVDSLASRFGFIPLHGPFHDYRVAQTDDVYVPLPLSLTIMDPAALRTGEAAPPPGSVRYGSVTAALEGNSRIVVLGDPGGGKSTILRHFCLRSCRAVAERATSPLPIFFEIRKVGPALATAARPLIEMIVSEALEQGQMPVDDVALRHMLLHFIEVGRAVVIFDGVDEIIDVVVRRRVVQLLQQFMDINPNSKYILSCRTTDYLRTPLVGVVTMYLDGMSDDDIKRYFRLFAIKVANAPAMADDRGTEIFLQQVRRQAAEFMRNPLLLTLIIWLYLQKRNIPDNRAEIYQECAQLLFVRWDKEKQLDVDIDPIDLLLQLITSIAGIFMDRRHQAVVVSDRDLRGGIKEFFLALFERRKEAKAERATTQFIEFLQGRAWLIQGTSYGGYEFIHRTFLEYFYARHLVDAYHNLDTLAGVVREHVAQGRNLMASHLAIQLWSGTYAKRSAAFLDRLLSHLEGARLAKARGDRDGDPIEFCRFTAEATKYLRLNEQDVARVTRELVVEAGDVREWSGILFDVLEAAQHNRDGVLLGIREGMTRLLADGKLERVGVVADWLYAQRIARHGVFSFPGDVRTHVLSDLFLDVERDLASALDVGSRPASYAKLVFDLTGHLDEGRARESGIRLWSFGAGIDNRLDWRFVDFTLALRECVVARLEDGSTRHAYRRLAEVVADALPHTAPQRHATGYVVTSEVRWEEVPAGTVTDALSDPACRRPTALALMGLHEVCTTAGLGDSPPYLHDIPAWIDAAASGDTEFDAFARSWSRGCTRIFETARRPRTYALGVILERALLARSVG